MRFNTRREVTKKSGLKYLLVFIIILLVVITLSVPGRLQAKSSVLGYSELKVNIPVTSFARFTILDSGDRATDYDPDSFFSNDFLAIEVLNPLESYTNEVSWEVETNSSNILLSFKSIGYDENDDIGSLTDDYIKEFVRYKIKDSSSIYDSSEFAPGEGITDIEYNKGTFTVAYSPESTDKFWCANEAGQYRDVILVTISEIPALSTETAFAGDTTGPSDSAWWFYFDINDGITQQIIAGQHIQAGYIDLEKQNGEVNISLYLFSGWSLKDHHEAVKVQGYQNFTDLPERRPSAGQFTTYKGDKLNFSFEDDNYQYFVIHLDLVEQY